MSWICWQVLAIGCSRITTHYKISSLSLHFPWYFLKFSACSKSPCTPRPDPPADSHVRPAAGSSPPSMYLMSSRVVPVGVLTLSSTTSGRLGEVQQLVLRVGEVILNHQTFEDVVKRLFLQIDAQISVGLSLLLRGMDQIKISVEKSSSTLHSQHVVFLALVV